MLLKQSTSTLLRGAVSLFQRYFLLLACANPSILRFVVVSNHGSHASTSISNITSVRPTFILDFLPASLLLSTGKTQLRDALKVAIRRRVQICDPPSQADTAFAIEQTTQERSRTQSVWEQYRNAVLS